MNKLLAALIAGTFAAMSVSALAQTTAPATKDAKGVAEEKAMQQNSTNMAPSAPVNKNTPAADPVAKPGPTKADKKAAFAAKQKALEAASTNMPASAPVNKATAASDPVAKLPKDATKDEKKAAFKAKEQGLQGAATNNPVESKPDSTAQKLNKDEKKAVSKDVGKGSTGQ